ncbi:MAG: beta-N-acetylhexosaminidase [Prevotella sp.]|nr:beta-N-acetylhexosaminidase [Prevotella sp.]
MQTKPFLFLLLLVVGASFRCAAAAETPVADYQVIPLPQTIQPMKGDAFLLDSTVVVVAPPSLAREAQFLCDYVAELCGLRLRVTQSTPRKGRCIVLAVDQRASQGAEGYVLNVDKRTVSISGGSAAGVFYAVQTLRKSIPLPSAFLAPDERHQVLSTTFQPLNTSGLSTVQPSTPSTILFPAVRITDAPRFGWRGMHLDCSRHFFSVDFVKKYIDLLALHNMNVFHWHLTDDQGWRIEIKSWPRLVEVGSMRSGTVIGINSDLDDHTPHGGYYTQQQARDIVEYARQRHITVVPEIDMPGHMVAALASYPELGCTGGPYEVGHYWGVYKDVLCVANPKVYQFVEDVLTEIMQVFPSEVIHIGGDETPTDRWKVCPKCQAQKLPQGVTLQGYFTQRVFDFLTSHHRRALGWDELLENNAPQNTMIMSWRGSQPGALAAQQGHDVVMTPTSHCYFDYQQNEETDHEPSRCSGFIPVEKVYSLEPVPDSLADDARRHILGVQANLWAEYLTTPGLVEYQALPRMTALAEVQWTQPRRKDYDAFVERLTRMTRLFDRCGYHYAKNLWPERQLPSRWQF